MVLQQDDINEHSCFYESYIDVCKGFGLRTLKKAQTTRNHKQSGENWPSVIIISSYFVYKCFFIFTKRAIFYKCFVTANKWMVVVVL